MDGQTDKKRTNEQMELHQFRKEPSSDGDLSPCQTDKKWTNERTELHQFRKEPSYDAMNSIGQTVFELESGNENVDGQMDGQTNGQKMDKRTHGITPISKGT